MGILSAPLSQYMIWWSRTSEKPASWGIKNFFRELRNLAVYFSAYLEKAYWVEMFNIIKTIYDRDMRIVRATRYSAVDFVLFMDSITVDTFCSEATNASRWGVKHSSIYSYYRLSLYFYSYHNIKLTLAQYLHLKNNYNIKFNSTNSYFNGLELDVIAPIIYYCGVNHPLQWIITWYKGIKTLILALLITIVLTLLCVNFFYINLLRQLAIWAIVGLLFFWLISGFNFFLKRYRFGKFTSAILRFWKRTNAVFWIIEGFLFSLFFYYYLNSSQEPVYFYDTSSLNQDYLVSLTNVYFGYLLLVIMIWYSYCILLRLPQTIFKQNILHLTIITCIFIYIFLLESYQLYYTLTIFYESLWSFDSEANIWVLETESPRLRNKQQYLLLALIAKYWHFLFIFVGWLFFIFKSFEQKRVHYTQLGYNIQNLLVLFTLNILFIAQWAKWMVRRFADAAYYWFFTDANMFSSKLYVDEAKLFLINFFHFSNTGSVWYSLNYLTDIYAVNYLV